MEEYKFGNYVVTNKDQTLFPKTKWVWDVFGGGMIIVNLTTDPKWWRVLLTKIFLGSVWKRID